VAQLGLTVQKWIKMLFGVNTLGGPWNIVLQWGADPSQRGEGQIGENFYQLWTQLWISGTVAARDNNRLTAFVPGLPE